MKRGTRRGLGRAGFTLIELLVVVLIIGILAAIAVPQYFRVVEKGRFSEALSTFSEMKGAQERFMLKANSYTSVVASLDVTPAGLRHFGAPVLATGAGSWTATLTRGAATIAGSTACPASGCYTITFAGPMGTYSCGGAGSAACVDMLP